MGATVDLVVSAWRMGHGYVMKLTDGVTSSNAARLPVFDGGKTVIQTNHPTFVFGHLGLYPAKLASRLGISGEGLAAPAGFDALFAAGQPCKDDPAGTIYPAWDVVLKHYVSSHELLMQRLGEVPDSVLMQPNPDERSRAYFARLGDAMVFTCTSHIMVHMGQVSAWRRCMGMPSAMG